MIIIKCKKCGNNNLDNFNDISIVTPTSKKPLKECKKCGKYNDYYNLFGESIGQMIAKEHFKELSTVGEVYIRDFRPISRYH